MVKYLNILNKIDGVHRFQSKQWLAASAASLTMVNVGMEEHWILQTLKNMKNSDFISKNTAYHSWTAIVLCAISSLIGAILGGILADGFGRKKTLLTTSIFVIAQTVGSFFTNSGLSCVTLFLGEVGLLMTRVVLPLYVSEIADDNIRGALLVLQLPFFYFGKLIAIAICNLVSTEAVCVVSLILTGIFIVTFARFPETPYYLALKKKDEAATKSLAFYRGVVAEEEIEMIMKNVEVEGDSQGCRGKIRDLVRPTNRKGFVIIMFLIILKWSEQIFDSQSHFVNTVMNIVVLSEYHAKIIAHVISLITSFLIVFIIDVFGRRSLLLCSTFLSLSIIIIAATLGENISYAWVRCLIVTILHSCEVIVFSVLLVYVGELFSANVKTLAIAVVTTFDLLITYVIVVFEVVYMDVNTIINVLLLLCAFPITLAFIPETKKKSFSHIQIELTVTFYCRWLRNKLIRTH